MIAQRAVTQHLRQFRQNLQMQICRLLWYQQHEHHIHRLTIRRLEGYWRGQAGKCTDRLLEALDATMWNGNTMTKTRRAKFLPRKQTVEHHASGYALVILEQQSSLLEQTLLAGDI